MNETITIDVLANAGKANKNLKDTSNAVNGVGTSAASTGGKMGALGAMARKVAISIGAMAAAFVGLAGAVSIMTKLIRVNAVFEESMSQVRAVTQSAAGFTEAAFRSMSEEARRLGATTKYTAGDAADGLKYLAMSGFTAQQATEALESTLELAQAGGLELGESAEIVSNILNQFGAATSRTAEFCNVLAITASRSNTDVRQMGEAMKYAGPVAGGLGRSVQETAAAIGTLANSGIQASIAGTALRGMMIGLADKSSHTYRTLIEMGATEESLNVRTRSLVDVMQTLKDVGVNAGNAYAIFTDRAGAAANMLTRNLDVFRSMDEAIGNTPDGLNDMADAMVDNLVGASREVTSAWEEMLLQVGDGGLNEGLRALVDGTAQMLVGFNELEMGVEVGESLSAAFSTLGAILGELPGVMQDLHTIFGPIAASIGALWNSMGSEDTFFGQIRQGKQERDLVGEHKKQSNFTEDIRQQVKDADSDEDSEKIQKALEDRQRVLEETKAAIERDATMGEDMKIRSLSQVNQSMAEIAKMREAAYIDFDDRGETVKNLQAELAMNIKINQAKAEQARIDKENEPSDAEQEEQARAFARRKPMRESLEAFDNAERDRDIAKGPKGQAKVDAYLATEGIDTEEDLADEMDALRAKLNTEGVVMFSEEEEKRMEALLVLMGKINAAKRESKDATKADKALADTEAILDAKLAGNKEEVERLEREGKINKMTEELGGGDKARENATRVVDKTMALEKQGRERETARIGRIGGAINAIVGRSSWEQVAKLASEQLSQQKEIVKELQEHSRYFRTQQRTSVF